MLEACAYKNYSKETFSECPECSSWRNVLSWNRRELLNRHKHTTSYVKRQNALVSTCFKSYKRWLLRKFLKFEKNSKFFKFVPSRCRPGAFQPGPGRKSPSRHRDRAGTVVPVVPWLVPTVFFRTVRTFWTPYGNLFGRFPYGTEILWRGFWRIL